MSIKELFNIIINYQFTVDGVGRVMIFALYCIFAININKIIMALVKGWIESKEFKKEGLIIYIFEVLFICIYTGVGTFLLLKILPHCPGFKYEC
jgi:hypothetical protein